MAPVDAVRMAAAHHHRMRLAGQAHVVGVAALTAQQGRVLQPVHRLTQSELGQGPAFGLVSQIHRILGCV